MSAKFFVCVRRKINEQKSFFMFTKSQKYAIIYLLHKLNKTISSFLA